MTILAATTASAQPAPGSADSADKPPLKQEELEQLLSPIALYPDELLTQMLIASTYKALMRRSHSENRIERNETCEIIPLSFSRRP
jgi:Protein of unknown function (DUF3300)